MKSRLKNLFAALLCFGLLGGNAGCGPPAEQGTVTGTVTLDGAPLAEGAVRFVPVAGDAPTSGATITEGVFTAEVPFGQMRVEFTAAKVVGAREMYEGMPDSPVVNIVEELIPAKYNVRSELMVDIQPGTNRKDFTLSTEKKK